METNALPEPVLQNPRSISIYLILAWSRRRCVDADACATRLRAPWLWRRSLRQ